MKFFKGWGSHLPILMKLVNMTDGDILELGTGIFSTPYLHWACFPDRNLVSYESDEGYYKRAKKFEAPFHQIIQVRDWDEARIKRRWSIALVDHAPDSRRIVEIRKLARFALYVVAHDANLKLDRHYHYSEIYPLFKYRYHFTACSPETVVLSNFREVDKLWPTSPS